MSEMPDVYRLSERKARKDHQCCECKGVIGKGEKYNYHSGIWNGEPASYKVCLDCDALRKQVMIDYMLYPEEVPSFGGLGDDLEGDHQIEFNRIREMRRGVYNAS